MNGEQRNRRAAVLLILASAMWWAEWIPAVFVTAFFLWMILHKRLEDDPGGVLLRWWRRVWPPATLVLIPLLLTDTFVFWVSTRPAEAKVLPVALNLFALSMILFGSCRKALRAGGGVPAGGQESSNVTLMSLPQPSVESRLAGT